MQNAVLGMNVDTLHAQIKRCTLSVNDYLVRADHLMQRGGLIRADVDRGVLPG